VSKHRALESNPRGITMTARYLLIGLFVACSVDAGNEWDDLNKEIRIAQAGLKEDEQQTRKDIKAHELVEKWRVLHAQKGVSPGVPRGWSCGDVLFYYTAMHNVMEEWRIDVGTSPMYAFTCKYEWEGERDRVIHRRLTSRMEALFEAGCPLENRDEQERTPMEKAINSECVPALAFLVKHGVIAQAEKTLARAPLKIAYRTKDKELIGALEAQVVRANEKCRRETLRCALGEKQFDLARRIMSTLHRIDSDILNDVSPYWPPEQFRAIVPSLVQRGARLDTVLAKRREWSDGYGEHPYRGAGRFWTEERALKEGELRSVTYPTLLGLCSEDIKESINRSVKYELDPSWEGVAKLDQNARTLIALGADPQKLGTRLQMGGYHGDDVKKVLLKWYDAQQMFCALWRGGEALSNEERHPRGEIMKEEAIARGDLQEKGKEGKGLALERAREASEAREAREKREYEEERVRRILQLNQREALHHPRIHDSAPAGVYAGQGEIGSDASGAVPSQGVWYVVHPPGGYPRTYAGNGGIARGPAGGMLMRPLPLWQ